MTNDKLFQSLSNFNPDQNVKKITITQGNIETAVKCSKSIPEFRDPPGIERYKERLVSVPHLILIAKVGEEIAGFKVGYQREDYFYSWMGGILPTYRQMGIAKMLADAQEDWAKQQGYDSITFKTRNQHKGMLIFALKNGFDIIGFKEKEDIATNRILLRKVL